MSDKLLKILTKSKVAKKAIQSLPLYFSSPPAYSSFPPLRQVCQCQFKIQDKEKRFKRTRYKNSTKRTECKIQNKESKKEKKEKNYDTQHIVK